MNRIFDKNKNSQKIFSLFFSLVNQKKKEFLSYGDKFKLLKSYLERKISNNKVFFFFPKSENIWNNFWYRKFIFFFFQTLWKGDNLLEKANLKEFLLLSSKPLYFSEDFEIKKIGKKLDFIEERVKNVKNELKKNRQRFYIANSKLNKISSERKKRFITCVEEIAMKINLIYKELTGSNAAPLGGTAFLNVSNSQQPFFGKVIYTAIPPYKKLNDINDLSGGEKAIAFFVLVFALSIKARSPFILLDEIDVNLDNWFSKKLFIFLVNWSKKKRSKIGIITFRMRFYFFFGTIFYIYLNRQVSNLITFNPRLKTLK
jgi:hypothetical protein